MQVLQWIPQRKNVSSLKGNERNFQPNYCNFLEKTTSSFVGLDNFPRLDKP